jgi:ubiquinone/menaquinone biosynthesis C-methylase UbiE
MREHILLPEASMSQPTQFDAAKFKRTTEQQWQEAAQAWYDWTPTLAQWLGPATDVMLNLAQLKLGDRVLDIAAGTGEQSVCAAQRVGPTGHVLATDISSNILEFVSRLASDAGQSNISTAVMDGEDLQVDVGSYDAVISRVGLIYFPDKLKALSEVLRALKPGGRFATIVYSTPEHNRFFSDPVRIIRQAAELPPPLPGQPGPFSLGAEGVLADLLTEAGFTDVQIEVVPAPLRLGSARDCLRFEKESFGALHQLMAGLSPERTVAVWKDVGHALEEFDTPDGFIGPCELLVAVGRKPPQA